jgi:magnesium transporter
MNETDTGQGQLLDQVVAALQGGDEAALQEQMKGLYPAEVAQIIESLPSSERERLWHAIPDELTGQVLAEVGEVARTALASEIGQEEIIAAAENMEVADLADIIEELPDPLSDAILESLPHRDRRQVEETLAYPDDSVGRLMQPDVVTVRPDVTLDVVLRYLRRRKSLPHHTDGLMVIDREGVYLGKLTVSALLTSDPDLEVGEVMETGADRVRVSTTTSDVVSLFERRDLVSVAVVDDEDRLVGHVTVDDVLDVIREEADQQLLTMAGLPEEDDLFAPVLPSARRRALWLGVNLATAFLASWVIGLFQHTLDKVVALAVLMPIVASMGGIAGSQTLTLAIRGLALGRISPVNSRWLAVKEIGVGLLNGLLWACVVAIIAILWFGNDRIGMVIGAAMIVNLLIAALAGVAIPLILKRLNIDPALSGGVILTTVTDVVGFLTFLGLGTLVLL